MSTNTSRMMVQGMLMLAFVVTRGLACDCSGNDLVQSDEDSGLLDGRSLLNLRGDTRDSLEDIISPQLLQTYIALQLQKIAEDMASMTSAQDRTAASQPCASNRPLRRSRRLAPLREDSAKDVPIVAGVAEVLSRASRTTSSSSHAALKKSDEGDVPVFKGSPDGSQVRLVDPTPATARVVTPAVPIVKGSADPAHPARPSSGSRRVSGGLLLTPEEERALSVLLEGRHRVPSRPSQVSGVSGKVGGKPEQAQGQGRQQRPGSSQLPQSEAPGQPKDCCSQRRLLVELERQLALLRRLNADHLREEEWARANTLPGSYPSPYFPYLHNLPIHPARGMDDSTYYSYPGRPQGPMYFLPVPGGAGVGAGSQGPQPQGVVVRPRGATGWRALGFGAPPGPSRVATTPLDSWGCSEKPSARAANSGGHVDDKVKFSDQQKSNQDDVRASYTQAEDNIDAKLGEAVDVEI